jgi:transmembrane sensor
VTGQSDRDDVALDQAIAWHQALDRDDADWDGYIAWLEADPRHRALFDEIALLDRVVDERADALRENVTPAAASEGTPIKSYASGKSHRRWWLGGALAAALAAAIVIPTFLAAPADTIYTTASGETRRLAIGRGEVVELAPASQLIVKNGDPNALELAQGEAFFSVMHDPGRLLNIKAGDFAVSDIGTKFGINLAAGSVTVSVSEGLVNVAPPGGMSQRLGAGEQIIGHAGTLSKVKPIASSDVGSWRSGRLIYNDTPLRIVADDLARYSGKKVIVAPAISEQPFSGVLIIGDGTKLFQNVADLMAISYQANEDSVRFTAGPAR